MQVGAAAGTGIADIADLFALFNLSARGTESALRRRQHMKVTGSPLRAVDDDGVITRAGDFAAAGLNPVGYRSRTGCNDCAALFAVGSDIQSHVIFRSACYRWNTTSNRAGQVPFKYRRNNKVGNIFRRKVFGVFIGFFQQAFFLIGIYSGLGLRCCRRNRRLLRFGNSLFLGVVDFRILFVGDVIPGVILRKRFNRIRIPELLRNNRAGTHQRIDKVSADRFQAGSDENVSQCDFKGEFNQVVENVSGNNLRKRRHIFQSPHQKP